MVVVVAAGLGEHWLLGAGIPVPELAPLARAVGGVLCAAPALHRDLRVEVAGVLLAVAGALPGREGLLVGAAGRREVVVGASNCDGRVADDHPVAQQRRPLPIADSSLDAPRQGSGERHCVGVEGGDIAFLIGRPRLDQVAPETPDLNARSAP